MTTGEQPEKSEKDPTETPTGERTQEQFNLKQFNQDYLEARLQAKLQEKSPAREAKGPAKGTFIRRQWKLLAFALGVVVVLVVLRVFVVNRPVSQSNYDPLATWSGPTASSQATEPAARSQTAGQATEAGIRISTDGTYMVVTNKNDFVWTEPTVWVNGDISTDAWHFKYPADVLPGGVIDVPLSSLTRDKDDARFNPFEHAVKSTFIEVKGYGAHTYGQSP